MTSHPFAGRAGSAFRTRIAAKLYADQHGKCAMCGDTINPSLRGTKGSRAAVLDHIRPHRIRPDLSRDPANLHLVCKSCHDGTCASIEARHWPDADRIATEKAAEARFALTGWRV